MILCSIKSLSSIQGLSLLLSFQFPFLLLSLKSTSSSVYFFFSSVSPSSYFGLFSTIFLNLSLSCSILCFILLYNKETVSHTLYSISESALRVTAIGAEAVLYTLLVIVFIQLVVLILGFSFRYCWFMGKSFT